MNAHPFVSAFVMQFDFIHFRFSSEW